MVLIIALHVIACVLLIGIILVQRGRCGGLAESFSGAESMFGTKTNAFLTRATTVLSIVFFFTCLSLAFLSAKQSRSLMRDIKVQEQQPAPTAPVQEKTQGEPVPAQTQAPEETPKQEAPKTE